MYLYIYIYYIVFKFVHTLYLQYIHTYIIYILCLYIRSILPSKKSNQHGACALKRPPSLHVILTDPQVLAIYQATFDRDFPEGGMVPGTW